MKLKAWKVGVFYAVLIIVFKIVLLKLDLMLGPLGRLSNLIMYLGLFPMCLWAIYLHKSQAKINGFGLREGVKSGLTMVVVFAIIYSVFNYFFFKYELIDLFLKANEAAITKEGKTIDQARALFSPFHQVTGELFGNIGFGGLASVLMSLLIGRK
jgi:hypothetical protein